MSETGNGNRSGHFRHDNRGFTWWQSLWRGSRGVTQDQAAYRRLALQLHYDLPRESSTRSALLLTPVQDRLGARAGIGLALSLGQELNRPVLLVDACPARPELTAQLSDPSKPGWTNLLEDMSRPLLDFVQPTVSERVWFLAAGTDRLNPATPEALQGRLAEAQRQYDFVLLSGGSVLEDVSGMALLPCVGSVLLLVTENETRTADLNAAEEALVLCKARNVRLVLASPFKGHIAFMGLKGPNRPSGTTLGL